MGRKTCLIVLAAIIVLGAGSQATAGHWVLAFWRSLNQEEASNNLFARIWTFDETGVVLGGINVVNEYGMTLATTDAVNGRADFVIGLNNEYRMKIYRAGDTSELSPPMSISRYPNYGHYSYELGFMYKSSINNPGTFDTSLVGGAAPVLHGTSSNAPVTASLAYHSFDPWSWSSDVGVRQLPGGGWGEHGQTFVATGNRVAAVQFHPTVGGVNQPIYYTVDILDGGPNGALIARRNSSMHYNQDWWMTPFGTTACPVVPGQTYFARIYAPGGFNAYYMGTSFYPNGLANGQAYWRANSSSPWQLAQYPDLKGFVVCCNYTSAVFVTGVQVSPSSGKAVVTWTTDVPASSRVDYGATTSYGKSVSSPALTTSHSMTLSGLHADELYHFKVTSSAPGLENGVSPDMAFMTDSVSPNLLVNGGFNTGLLTPWVRYGQFSNPSPKGADGIAPWCVDQCPWDDPPYCIVSATQHDTQNGGVYQRVTGLVPGETYVVRMRYFTRQEGGANSDVANKLGFDTAGGTNPAAGTIVWSGEVSSQAAWAQASISAKPTGTAGTVVLQAIQKWALAWNVNGFDDVRLIGPQTGTIPTIKGVPDGASVTLFGKVVTATAAQIGAYYVQEPDAPNGIRVQTASGSASVGQLVRVRGWMATVDGERAIIDATISPAGTDDAVPVAMVNKALGGADFNSLSGGVTDGIGINTVGLLVRVFGQVVTSGSGEFTITDGSTNTLRIKAPAGAALPPQDSYVGVTGICRLQSAADATVPYLEIRQMSDWRAYK